MKRDIIYKIGSPDKNSSSSNQIKIDLRGEQAPAKEGDGPAVVWSQQLGVSLGLKSNDDEEFMMNRWEDTFVICCCFITS